MKKTSLYFIIAIVLVIGGTAVLFFSFFSFARAETVVISPDSDQPATPVATVNIYNAKIVSRENNKFQISFDLSNRTNVQPGVRYSISLIELNDGRQGIADEKIYPETVDLGENQTIIKEMVYEAPVYLSGIFQLWLSAENDSGTKLSSVHLEDVILNGNDEFLEISSGSCYLKVDGEAGDKKYNLKQGVDIKSDEKLVATCEVINNYDKAVSFMPQFKTYWRSVFGQEVNDNQELQTKITLQAQEKKEISFILPKALKPQAYDAVVELVSDQSNIASSKVTFHYVLRGASATIQSIKLDKDYYVKGENAKLSLFWAAAADAFPGSRLGATESGALTAQIKITDKNGKNCVDATNKELTSQNIEESLSLPIIATCANPQISAIIKDSGGNILDQKEYAVESKSVNQAKSMDRTQLKKYGIYSLIVIVILIVIGLIAFFFRRRGAVMLFLFFLLFGFGLFYSTGQVHAQAEGYTYGLDKTLYTPEESMKATGYGLFWDCDNHGAGNGGWEYELVDVDITSSGNWRVIPQSSGYLNINAPSVPGSYTATFYTNAYTSSWCDSDGYCYDTAQGGVKLGSIDYTVTEITDVDLKIDGSDGPVTISNGTSHTLSWNTSNTSYCEASGAWSGAKVLNGSQAIGPLTALSATYTLTCSGSGDSKLDSVTVNIPPPPTNPSYSFGPGGASAAISWTPASGYTNHYLRVRNPDGSVYYDNNDYAGSSYTLTSITPGQNYTWWVHTRAANGSYSASVGGSFTYSPPNQPPVITAPDTVTYPIERSGTFTFSVSDPDDSSNVFSWRWQYPTHSSYCGDSASGFPSGSINVPFNSGTITVTPTYYPDEGCDGDPGLIISAYDGEATTEKTISFIPDIISPPGSFNLSLNGSASCNSVPLTWTQSSGADYYKILRGSSRVDITPYQPYTAQNYTDSTPIQGEQYIYQIESYNAGGDNRSNAINVDVPYCLPAVSLSANPTSIYQGQITTLTWTSSNTIWCSASGAWSGSKPLSGNEEDKPSPPSAVYYLTCGGPGGTNTVAATVEVLPLALPEWREIIPR